MKKAGKRKGRVREDDSYASAPDKIPEAADKAPSVDAQIDQKKNVIPTQRVESVDSKVASEQPTADASVEAAEAKNRANIQRALLKGKSEWGRSKIMIVGEGRAGKSAFANTIIGRPFSDTESTVGINQLTCDIKYASIGSGNGWAESKRPERELEAAVAVMVAAGDVAESIGTDKASTSAQPAVQLGDKSDLLSAQSAAAFKLRSRAVHSAAESSVVPNGSAVGLHSKPTALASIGENGQIGKYMDETMGADMQEDHVMLDENAAKSYDSELIMKCLADKVQTASKLLLSVYDFGGQSVFNVIHHFFLTRFGVYTVVFNMEWLVGKDASIAAHCLATLKFWINSIVVHTLDADTGETAPIAIIGTRKDKISSPADHQRISTILYDHFSSSLAWANVIENDTAEGANGRASLFFYPVDNLKGRADPSVVACLRDIERVLEKAEYVHREQPLVYLQWLDKVTALKKMYLSYEEAVGVAVACGVALDDASQMLNLFHEMGIVMFHDEPELRDVVILDPINFFVVPVTTVICKHAPTETDPTHHLLEVHKLCRKKKHLQWQKFTKNGIVSDDLLRMLLMGHEDNYDRLVRLMIKFGLLVRLQSSADDTSATVKSEDVEYLVPALMPANPSPEASWSDQEYSTCYLIFSTSKEFEQSITISESDLETYGFLPQGLYERLIGRAVAWAQQTSSNYSINNYLLTKDVAVLSFGSQRFRLRLHEELCTIEVNIEGRNPRAALKRLMEQIRVIIEECMKSLVCFCAVKYSSDEGDAGIGHSRRLLHDQAFLIPLSQIRSALESHSVLNRPGGRRLLSESEVRSNFSIWIDGSTKGNDFDVFLSYRWAATDSAFVECVYDRFTLFTIGEDNRAVHVFLDKECLQEGRMFQNEFAKSMRNSRVVIPIISSNALIRFCTGDGSIEDNVMVEWLMAMEYYANPSIPLKRIFPIFFGNRNDVFGKIGNLFVDPSYKSLPSTQPMASIQLAARLLRENGIEPRPEMFEMTAAGIVENMKKFLCIFAWNISNPDFLTTECVNQIQQVLQSSLADADTTPAAISRHDPNIPVAEANVAGKGALSLPRSIEILREQLGIEVTAVAAVVGEALKVLGDDELEARSSGIKSLAKRAEFIVREGLCYAGE